MDLSTLQQPGLFSGKEWRVSNRAFELTARETEELEKLGHRLYLFYKAVNLLYRQSNQGRQPSWVAEYTDAGKPPELVELSRAARFRDDLPRVIRPDLILTEEGFAISELDSVPGGIGLTAWLQETYGSKGFDLLGGTRGMLDGFQSILPNGADILVSDEAQTYRPEMEWLAEKLNLRGEESYTVHRAEEYVPVTGTEVYRFFELFDLPNISSIPKLLEKLRSGEVTITPPIKPYLEEKLWLALFWSRPLREFWRRELHERHWLKLQRMIPFGWVLDPLPVPHHAEIPRLGIQNWEELGEFTQKQRELVLKISGFNELAWGARGVTVGQDVSQQEWKRAVDTALRSFNSHPYVLQEFKKAKIVEHPWTNLETGEVTVMRGRVRVCPYYFVAEGRAKLGGVLCTIVPLDKKIIHGMSEAILVPGSVAA